MLHRIFQALGADAAAERRIRESGGRHRRSYVWGTLAVLASNLLVLGIPRVLQRMIDRLAAGNLDRRALLTDAGGMVLLALVGNAVRVASRLLLFNTGRQIEYTIRNELFARFVRRPIKAFARRTPGDLMSRATNDLGSVRLLFGFAWLNFVNTVFTFAGALAMMIALDARLTLASLAIYPFFVPYIRRFSRRMFERTLRVQEHLGAISNLAQEAFNGIHVVKAYTMEKREGERFAARSGEYCRDNIRLALTRNYIFNFMTTVGRGSIFVVLLYGGWRMIRGELSYGAFAAFNAYLSMTLFPAMFLGFMITVWQRGMAALRRIEEVLAEPEEIDTIGPPLPADPRRYRGPVEFRNLSFTYPDAHAPALREFDLTIPAGERLAVVGPTGSGKSTLGVALLRLFDTPPGAVFIGGADVTRIPLAQLRRHVGFVTQNHFLFSATLETNIAFGRADAEREAVRRTVEMADFARDLQEFPEGYRMMVGERGVTLSGGQRQRATLARALLYDPDILVLDDVFSNVDLKTEETILANLERHAPGKTLVMITHRIATAARAERIVVLQAGRIVDIGAHEALTARCSLYAEMARLQALEAEIRTAAS